MLYEKIENQKEILDAEDYEIPSYITDSLKFPLYEWQKSARSVKKFCFIRQFF